MCEYVSFLVDLKGKIYVGDLRSHAGIEQGWGLKPGSAVEAEWIGEDENSLTVRTEDPDHNANWFKALILAEYKTRSDLLKTITEGRSKTAKIKIKNGEIHCSDGPAIEDANGRKEWYVNGKLHRVDGPAVEWADGAKEWYVNGERHCEDVPAVEWADGSKAWYVNGKIHRKNGPAIEYADGSKSWWVNGKLHRVDGPAVECADGSKSWYVNGELHRLDGPAVEDANGSKEWFIHGVFKHN